MNILVRTSLLLTSLFLLISHVLPAQGVSKKREYSGFFDSYYYRGPLSITLGGGTALYAGDLGFYNSPGFALNLGANYKIWPRTILGAEFNYFSLSANSADTTLPSFKGNDWGVNLYGRLYLIDDIIRKSSDRRTNKKVKPYIATGLGFVKYKAVTTPAGGGRGITPVFPLGFGIEFKITPKLQLIPEYTHTFTLNDLIDGAKIKKGKDGYGMISLKIQYSPWGPKKKKKFSAEPVEPNQNREEHQEWRKKKTPPPPPAEETPLPEENQEEQPTEEQPTEEVPEEEKPEGN